MPTRLTYIGPHLSVRVPLPPDGAYETSVDHGGVLETTAEHAERLLEQPTNWEPVKAAKKADKAEKGGDD